MALSGSITPGQRYQLAREAGFSPADAVVMAAISLAECANCEMSQGYGGPAQRGKLDRGLWQINDIHGYSAEAMADPVQNAQAAYKVWKGAGGGLSGFRAWCTYPGGCGGGPGVPNFSNLLMQATSAAQGVDPNAPVELNPGGSGAEIGAGESAGIGLPSSSNGASSGDPCASAGEGVAFGLGPVAVAFCRIGHLLAPLGTHGFWWAVLFFGGGLALIVAGVLFYFRQQIQSAGAQVARAAAVAA